MFFCRDWDRLKLAGEVKGLYRREKLDFFYSLCNTYKYLDISNLGLWFDDHCLGPTENNGVV